MADQKGEICALIENESGKERATLKGEEIAKLGPCPRTSCDGFDVEIVEMNPIEGGVEVFARAWDENGQLGFGPDGSVDIERFRIINPPILIPAGTWRTVPDKDGKDMQVEDLKEDPQAALLQSLAHTISVKREKFDAKNIKAGKVGSTTSTFYPDANVESTSVDGTCGWSGSDTDFATVRADAGNATNPNDSAASVNDNVNNYLCRLLNGASDFNQLRQMNRAIFLFDTSAIPDTDSISSATFSIAGNGGPVIDTVNGGGNGVYLDKCNPASNTAIAGTDFDITKWDTVAQADAMLAYGSWPADNVYADFTLNATGRGNISKTGITKLGLRDSIDFLNTGLSGNLGTAQNGANCDLADTSGTTTDPKLVVEHAGSGPAGVKTLNGTAVASVKTKNGTAWASVKTVNGTA